MTSSAFGSPRVELVGGSIFNWGEISPRRVYAKLHVANVGDDTLRIWEVRVSCGCTTAPISKEKIAPGDTAILDVSIDMREKEGEQRKEVYLLTNDPLDTLVTISLRANLLRDLIAKPAMFPALLDIPPDKEAISEVEITNISEDTIVLGTPSFQARGMKAQFGFPDGNTLAPHSKCRLVVVVTPTLLGFLTASIVVPTSSSRMREVSLSFRCLVKSERELERQSTKRG